MLKDQDKKSLAGISCVLCGFLYLIHELNMSCSDMIIFDPKIYPLYISAIFFLGRQRDIALLSFIVGVVVLFPKLVDLMDNYSDLIWPVIIIVIGVILVFGNKKGFGRRKRKNDAIEEATIVEDDDELEK